MMYKGLFFSLPSVSVTKVLTPVADKLSASGYEIIYYNTEGYLPAGDFHFTRRVYPAYQDGYHPGCMDMQTSYLQFAEILMDTAASLMDFLLTEVEREKPDFILHTHLATWGKLVARYYGLPAVSLFSTFMLDQQFMQPLFRKLNAERGRDAVQPAMGLNFFRKARTLYDRLGFRDSPDIWDTYVNREKLNILFVHELFQPGRELFGDGYRYAGFPLSPPVESPVKNLIYVAMGTMLNNDTAFYALCIRVLARFPYTCILSVGDRVDITAFGVLPPTIRIVRFADQVSILNESALFLTMGGMASVQEALLSGTPMIVIPSTPEQYLTAEKIAELDIGVALPRGSLSEEGLTAAVRKILDENAWYIGNVRALLADIRDRQGDSPVNAAFHWIDNYLKDAIGKTATLRYAF